MSARHTPDRCPDCGSEDLFSGFFDADDYAFPLGIDTNAAVVPEGVRWTTFCNQCGEVWNALQKLVARGLVEQHKAFGMTTLYIRREQ